jgi:hypothetical protein
MRPLRSPQEGPEGYVLSCSSCDALFPGTGARAFHKMWKILHYCWECWLDEQDEEITVDTVKTIE